MSAVDEVKQPMADVGGCVNSTLQLEP